MSLTNYAAQATLNSIFGKTSNFGALASAPTIYVALSSTAPAEDGTNITEPTAGGYARVQTAAADWSAATLADPSVITNANAIDFGTATATWLSGADLTHAVAFDAATGGNALAVAALTTPKPVTDGDPVSFAAGAFEMRLD